MTPIEKLRADVQYWEAAERDAQEALAIAQAVLPGLREKLQKFERHEATITPDRRQGAGAVAKPTGSPPISGDSPRFRGDAYQQVQQALLWKAPQSSHDLKDTLALYGRAYGPGAINGALRLLEQHGTIKQVTKKGNLRFYAPKQDAGSDDGGR